MAQVINTNITSLNSQRHLNNTNSALSKAMERLSSGKRINSAKDDAAGLGISARMTTQVNGMNQAIRNANDGISMTQTAEGALSTSEEMLQRIRTLAVQSSNATNSSIDRQAMQDEVNQLTAELNRIAQTTKFNGQNILDGTMAAQNFQVGANAGELITSSGTNFQTHVYGNNRVYSQAQEIKADAKFNSDFTVAGKLGKGSKIEASNQLMSAKEVAQAVNAQENKTGVTASAKTEVLFTATTNTSYTVTVASNNDDAITISFTIGEDLNSDGYAAAINAFNAVSAKTGVTAEFASVGTQSTAPQTAFLDGIKLTNADGETISLAASSGAGAKVNQIMHKSENDITYLNAEVALDTTAKDILGTVTFDSDASFSILDNTTADFDKTASQLKSVSTLDVTDFDKAQQALAICDAAINVINAERAKYGALQSRFESTIKNLEVNSENTSNARSRIQDADYASETAELSRASILQQAGTAMLAQANQLPQTVLSLIG